MCIRDSGKTKSKQGRMADALALGGDEGRDKLRYCLLYTSSVFGEPVDTKIDRFYNIVERELISGHFVFRDAPNVIRKKLPYISDFLLHGSWF